MQATVRTFDASTQCGEVVLDDGTSMPYDAQAFAVSGLRALNAGQRVRLRVAGPDGHISALTFVTLPLPGD